MGKFWIIGVLLFFLSGCERQIVRMRQSEDPMGRYKEQISAAKRLLEQKETWADRAEWEVKESGDGWRLIAWRIEHPENTGAARYVPWGYSVIEVDRRFIATAYHRKG